VGTVTGLVLAAGGSTRLGQPKQLLPFGDGTLLDATLAMARACGFDQLIVTVGGSADEVVEVVDLTGMVVVRNPVFGEGCSSSIAAALPAIATDADGIVLLLGDQPMVDPTTVHDLVTAAQGADIAVTRYRDGIGHPFWLGRALFPQLATLHGDKGVWKLIDATGPDLLELEVDADIPRDVDTWDDYQALLDERGGGR
jgi:molybdenum cofactor cytidylyltransferase